MICSKPAVRLDILALPSQTSILFWLIFLVIGLPVMLSAVGRSVPCGPVVIVCVITFTTWDFLSGPERQIRRLQLTETATFPALNEHFYSLATNVAGLNRPPRLLISSDEHNGIHSFGTFTRRYVTISQPLAREFENAFNSHILAHHERAEAVLLHELAHFRNGDVWKALLSYSLLKVTAVFFTISLFSTLATPFLYHYGAQFYLSNLSFSPDMVRPFDAELATMLETLPQVGPQAMMRYEMYVLNAHWPLIVGSFLLQLFFWRRLLRVRELYADARVIAWQKKIQPLLDAIPWIAAVTILQPAPTFRERPVTQIAFRSMLSNSWFKRLFSNQPGLAMRRLCLDEPHQVYGGSLNIAVVAGFTAVLLNMTLSSLFTSRFMREPNATISLVVGFMVIAISYLPFILRQSGSRSDILRSLRHMTIIFTLIWIVPRILTGLIVAVGVLLYPDIIDWSAYTLILTGGENLASLDVSPFFVIDIFVLRPILFSALVVPLLLLLLLVLDTSIKRQVLTWYSSQVVQNHSTSVLWGISGALSAIVALAVLPMVNALVFPTAHSVMDQGTWIGFILATLLLIGLSLFLWAGHKRYARRCPACKTNVPGHYSLGRCCDQCGKPLYPHLDQKVIFP